MANIVPVILSGGMGVRLWPLSRRSHPKQFLSLLGDESLIVSTMRRVVDAARFYPPILVCNEDHRFTVAEQLREARLQVGDILLEPEARNTGAAIAAAAAYVSEKHGDALMLVLPSDHLVQKPERFLDAVDIGTAAAKSGHIVTFGIIPETPEVGYGYIESGLPWAADSVTLKIIRFEEKPDKPTAERFLSSGRHYWNAGMFLMKTNVALAAFEQARKGMKDSAIDAVTKSARDLDFIRLDGSAYEHMPSASFDKLVMESADNGAIVPVDMGWSDIGSWNAIWRNANRDQHDNAKIGDVIARNSTGCLVHAERGLAALIGVDNLVVVITADSVLIMDRDSSQELPDMVRDLEDLRRSEVEYSETVHRPWGHYENIDSGTGFRAKRIVVKPNGRLSLQEHRHRAEHWVVVRGTAIVTKGDETFALAANESVYIPAGTKHRLENTTADPLHLIEVQTGAYLEEDDIIRYDDAYGRG